MGITHKKSSQHPSMILACVDDHFSQAQDDLGLLITQEMGEKNPDLKKYADGLWSELEKFRRELSRRARSV